MFEHLKPFNIGLFERHTVNHTTNMIHVSRVALQQTEVSGHLVMETSDLRMLRPESDQNIVIIVLLWPLPSTR